MTGDDRLGDAEREELLELYEGVRVTDVTDALDYRGFHDVTHMDPEIAPLWRDTDGFSHRAVGFAHTVRFHPTTHRPHPDDRPAEEMEFEEIDGLASDWMAEEGAYGPFQDHIRAGDVIVIEAHGLDVGIVGSLNSLRWIARGANAVVTNGGVRDTDEVIAEGVPTYTREVVKTHTLHRAELDAVQEPVSLGGVRVCPDDVVVCDGDGVVVVPAGEARAVGEYAREIQGIDQPKRREYYDQLGLEADRTLE